MRGIRSAYRLLEPYFSFTKTYCTKNLLTLSVISINNNKVIVIVSETLFIIINIREIQKVYKYIYCSCSYYKPPIIGLSVILVTL